MNIFSTNLACKILERRLDLPVYDIIHLQQPTIWLYLFVSVAIKTNRKAKRLMRMVVLTFQFLQSDYFPVYVRY